MMEVEWKLWNISTGMLRFSLYQAVQQMQMMGMTTAFRHMLVLWHVLARAVVSVSSQRHARLRFPMNLIIVLIMSARHYFTGRFDDAEQIKRFQKKNGLPYVMASIFLGIYND